MYKLFISIILLSAFTSLEVIAQENKNILEHISNAIKNLPKRKTFVYSYVNWCGRNHEDANLVDSVLRKYSKCYNFVLLTNGDVELNNLPQGFSPDTIISYLPYYKTGFRKRKEPKQFANDFNQYYKTDVAYLLGPATAFLLDENGDFVVKFAWTYKEIESEFLNKCERK